MTNHTNLYNISVKVDFYNNRFSSKVPSKPLVPSSKGLASPDRRIVIALLFPQRKFCGRVWNGLCLPPCILYKIVSM